MHISVLFDKKKIGDNLFNFLNSNKKINFEFEILDNFLHHKDNNLLFVFSKKSKKNEILNFLDKVKILDNKKIMFFLPIALKDYFSKVGVNVLFYPIEILNFEKKILNIFKNNFVEYKNLQLYNDNILARSNDGKKIFLTEIESKILSILFQKKIIDRKKIKLDILNQNPSVVSKSLESHLYRLRKKILSLDKKIQIIVNDNQTITIK